MPHLTVRQINGITDRRIAASVAAAGGAVDTRPRRPLRRRGSKHALQQIRRAQQHFPLPVHNVPTAAQRARERAIHEYMAMAPIPRPRRPRPMGRAERERITAGLEMGRRVRQRR